MKISEHIEQVNVCRWLTIKGYDFFAVPNGYNKGLGARQKAKAEGLKSGVPDLIILNKSKVTGNPVALEMKAVKAKDHKICTCLEENQIEWKEIFKKHSWTHILAHGSDDAIETLEKLGY